MVVATILGLSHGTSLLMVALIAVVGLVILIARFRMHSFLALIIAALFVGLCSGMPLPDIGSSFQSGVGAVLGSIAMVIGLGTVLGKMLAESGGAERIAETLTHWFGPARLDWAMAAIAFLVGIPVFFSVGLVLLVPLVFAVARETRTPLLRLAIPMLAGLSVVHGLVPPHPGPMAALGLIGADLGKTIFYSLLVAVPTTALAGPLFGPLIARVSPVEPTGGLIEPFSRPQAEKLLPGFGVTVFTILLPVGLMMLGTLAEVALPESSWLKVWAAFVGHPIVALLLAVLVSYYTLGVARGFDRLQLLRFTEDCVGPVAGVLLVVGAGGGFNRVLVAGGIGEAISDFASVLALGPLVLGWMVAALIRVATGSATVAITTAAGMLAPVMAGDAGQSVSPELLILSMGAGSLILSHVNDGGFWLVKEMFGLSVTDTLKTWTLMETVISVTALGCILLLNALVG
jgi:GntP family gluconate:H+ symporter